MSKVSVIVPVYNVEKYLEKCIDSIVRQTYSDIEILLVDDGSTDSSGDICDKYAKQYDTIKVIHQDNMGLCGARNTGLELCTGNYVSFIDSDDFIDERFIETLYNESKKYNLDISFCNFKLFEDEVDLGKSNRDYLFTSESINGLDYLDLKFKHNDWSCYVWIGLYSTEFLKENKLKFYDKGKLLYEDILFTNKSLLKAKRVKFVSFYGYNYRNRWQDSLSRQKSNKFKIDSYYNIMNEFIQLYKLSDDKQEEKVIIKILYNVVTGLLESIHYSDEDDKDLYYSKIKNSGVLNILSQSLDSKKNFVKFIIFRLNLKLYYSLEDLRNKFMASRS